MGLSAGEGVVLGLLAVMVAVMLLLAGTFTVPVGADVYRALGLI